VLQFRFDAPGDAGTTALEGISGEGDSGGPAYFERDRVVYVVGVSSGQDPRPADGHVGHYGVLEYYPRVSAYADWIHSTMSAVRPSR
jgi:secreted trypsin-like serine protease